VGIHGPVERRATRTNLAWAQRSQRPKIPRALFKEVQVVRKFIIGFVLIATLLGGMQFAAAKSGKGKGRGPNAAASPEASAEPEASASPIPDGEEGEEGDEGTDEPGRGRKCRRHNPHKPRGDCPNAEPSAEPTEEPSESPTGDEDSGDEDGEEDGEDGDDKKRGRKCRRHNPIKPRGNCPRHPHESPEPSDEPAPTEEPAPTDSAEPTESPVSSPVA
jgi:hypothetical protein